MNEWAIWTAWVWAIFSFFFSWVELSWVELSWVWRSEHYYNSTQLNWKKLKIAQTQGVQITHSFIYLGDFGEMSVTTATNRHISASCYSKFRILPTFATTRTLKCLVVTVDFICGVVATREKVSFIGVARSGRQLNIIAVYSTQSVATMTWLSDFRGHSYYSSAQHITGKESQDICRKPHDDQLRRRRLRQIW